MTHEFDVRREEWIAREELAERMIPLIGGLYRDHGVVTSIHGRRLINRSAIELLKAHRVRAKRADVPATVSGQGMRRRRRVQDPRCGRR